MNNLQVLEQVAIQDLQGIETINRFGFPEIRQRQANPKIEHLSRERIEVSARAQKMGFTPLAVVPLKLLHAAAKKFGMYWFEEIDKEGRARVRLIKKDYINIISIFFERIRAFCSTPLSGIYATIISTVLILAVLMLIAGTKISARDLLWWRGLVFWSISSWLLYILSIVFNKIGQEKIKLNFLIFKTYFLPQRFLFKLLFRGNRSEASIHLYFNTPPNVFTQALNLMRRHKLQPCIAAVPEAISINCKELRQIIKNEQEKIKRERQRRRVLKADSILYYCDGNYAVIVAQHGNFTSERKLLKWARKHGLNLWLD